MKAAYYAYICRWLCIGGTHTAGSPTTVTAKRLGLIVSMKKTEVLHLHNQVRNYYSEFRGVDPYGTGGMSPNIYEGGTSMVMSPQYFRSDVV